MKRYKTAAILIVLLVTMYSCKKDKNLETNIDGQVQDFYTKSNITNRELRLSFKISNVSIFTHNPYPYCLQDAYTPISLNANGRFSTQFKGDLLADKDYVLILYDGDYISDPYPVIIGADNSIIIEAKPLKILSLIIQDTSDIYDRINVHINSDQKIVEYYSQLKSENPSNTLNDVIVNYQVVPNASCDIQYNHILNGSQTTFEQTIQVDNGDTTFYNIVFWCSVAT